jgi:hypothetical protein
METDLSVGAVDTSAVESSDGSNSNEPVSQSDTTAVDTGASASDAGTKADEPAAFVDKVRAKAKAAAVKAAPGAPAQTTPQVYTPNYKYKVHDQEKEFDELLRPIVKDAESEKKIREMHEKLFGFEVIKPKYEARTQELETIKKEYLPLKEGITQLKEYVAADDYDSFFQGVNIPEKKIMEWVAKKLQYQGLPPEEKARYDREVQLTRENAELKKASQGLQSESQQARTAARTVELDTALQSPEVNAVMQAFDSQVGKVGAFRDEVILRAQALYFQTGKDVTAKEAVESLLKLRGAPNQVQTTPANPATPQPQQTKPAAIPNIKSRGGSPVKKNPTSFEELRQRNAARLKELRNQ